MASASQPTGAAVFKLADPMTVVVNGENIPVVFHGNFDEAWANTALADRKVTTWLAEMEKNVKAGHCKLTRVTMQWVDKFGPRPGFIKLTADIMQGGKPGAGAILMRGDMATCLFVMRVIRSAKQIKQGLRMKPSNRKLKTIVCKQPRWAIARYDAAEPPAGMVDDKHNFAGVMAKEIKEELGYEINESQLIPLSKMYMDQERVGISIGGCDEMGIFYAAEVTITEEELEEFHGKETGNYLEGEYIRLEVIDLDDAIRVPDVKMLALLHLYQHHLKVTNASGPINPEADEDCF